MQTANCIVADLAACSAFTLD